MVWSWRPKCEFTTRAKTQILAHVKSHYSIREKHETEIHSAVRDLLPNSVSGRAPSSSQRLFACSRHRSQCSVCGLVRFFTVAVGSDGIPNCSWHTWNFRSPAVRAQPRSGRCSGHAHGLSVVVVHCCQSPINLGSHDGPVSPERLTSYWPIEHISHPSFRHSTPV